MVDALGLESRYNQAWWLVLIEGAVAFIVGILLFFTPVRALTVLVQLLAIYWLVGGILSFVRIFHDSAGWGWNLVSGVVGVLAGLTVIRHPLWSAFLVPTTLFFTLGIIGIINCVTQAIFAFQGGGSGAAVRSICSLLFGLVLLFGAPYLTLALPFVLGIIGVILGAMMMFLAFRIRQHQSRARGEGYYNQPPRPQMGL